MSGTSFSNILRQITKLPAIESGTRVQWVEETMGMFCSGEAIHAVSDCLGFPTRMYLVRVDEEHRPALCTTPSERASGCVYRHMIFHNLEEEKVREISLW